MKAISLGLIFLALLFGAKAPAQEAVVPAAESADLTPTVVGSSTAVSLPVLMTPPPMAYPRLPRSLAKPNALTIELLGRGGIYSLNYDRSFGRLASLGAGFSYQRVEILNTELSVTIVPIYASFYVTGGANRLFFTGGVDIVNVDLKTKGLEVGTKGGGDAAGTIAETGKFDATVFIKDADLAGATFPLPIAGLGYEFRGEGGILFRTTLYATYLLRFVPWAGISLGSAF